MGFQCSGVPEPPRVIPILCFLSISGALDTRIAQQFRIFTESTMWNTVKSIAQENRYQHLDSPKTDRVLYVSNHPGMDRLTKGYRVDVSYPKTQLKYSRHTRRLSLSISLLRNTVQAHRRSTVVSSVMVSDLTSYAHSIPRLISTSRDSLFTYEPTPGMPLNLVYPHRITFE